MISRIICLSSLSLLLFTSVPLEAQDTPSLIHVMTIKIRPGTNAQLEEFVQAYREASRQQGQRNYWRAAQSMSGELSYTFNFLRAGWGDMANPGPQLNEVFGEQEAARLWELFRRSVERASVAYYFTQPDMSNIPQDGESFDAAVYFHISLNPGMLAQYEEVARKTTEASSRLYPQSFYLTQTPSYGAEGIRVVGLIPSWSDLDGPGFPPPGQRVLEHFGAEEGGRINAMAAEAISATEVVLQRNRHDLSYLPGE